MKKEALGRRAERRKTGNMPVNNVESDRAVFEIIGEKTPIVEGLKSE